MDTEYMNVFLFKLIIQKRWILNAIVKIYKLYNYTQSHMPVIIKINPNLKFDPTMYV